MNSLWIVGQEASEVVPITDDGQGPTETWNELFIVVSPTRGHAKSLFLEEHKKMARFGFALEYVELQSALLEKEFDEPEGVVTEKHPKYNKLWADHEKKIDALVDRFRKYKPHIIQ